MRRIVLFVLVLTSQLIFAQVQSYDAYNISLVKHLTPNMGDFGFDGRRYSGCWGWYQSSKNKEYAISGTSNGTYFIDITAPASASVVAFVQAKQGCTYREMKTYKNYCYIISDDGQPFGFQIVDMQYLPDSLPIIYSGDNFFQRAHSIWIDGAKMYLGSVTYSNGFSSMAVYSLANPKNPQLLRKLNQDYPFINLVHDMYSRNDTVYASCANQGLYIFSFDSASSAFTQIGSYTGFPKAGYNHSSVLSEDGKHLIFCEEIPAGLPIRLINVENFSNIQPIKDFIPHNNTTPHNPFVRDDFAIVSCYEDGLYIYDISDPANPSRAGYFDTHPQGGVNTGTYGAVNYRGNWGAYPALPSKLIIANDMQNGVFILDATAAYTTTVKDPVALNNEVASETSFQLFPNPADGFLQIHFTNNIEFNVLVKDIYGRILIEKNVAPSFDSSINTGALENGTYFISLTSKNFKSTKKIIIHH